MKPKNIIHLILFALLLPGAGFAADEDISLDREQIVIMGEVAKPMAFKRAEETDLLDLLALCKGFTDDANVEKLLVIRRSGDVSVVDLRALGGVEIDGVYTKNGFILIKPGDVVVVPRRADAVKAKD